MLARFEPIINAPFQKKKAKHQNDIEQTLRLEEHGELQENVYLDNDKSVGLICQK